MTFSPLISGTIPHYGKYHSRSGASVVRVIQHHHAASSNAGTEALISPSAQKSVNYNVLSDGSIWGQVPEEYRAWTSGVFEADVNSITIEVQNCGGQINNNDSDPQSWAISDAAYNSVIILIADIAKRHKFGTINADNYQGHRQVSSTACPGGYLWNRMANTRAAANIVLKGGISSQGSYKPIPSEEDDMFTPQNAKELTAVVDDAERARNVLDSVEEGLHEKLLRVNRFIKGNKDDTVYELQGGYLRPLTSIEWKLWGKKSVDSVFPQSDIDKMPKLPVVS